MKAKVLETEQEILAAKALLYEVNVKEIGWIPREANPSGLRIEQRNGAWLLTDCYDAVATWFGVFDGDKIVGCHRLCGKLNGKHEVEHYHPLPAFLSESEKIGEFSRLAIRPEYRTRGAALLELIGFECRYVYESGYRYVFTTARFPNPGRLFIKLGLEDAGVPSFRYYPDDEEDVRLLYGNYWDKKKVETTTQLCIRLVERFRRRGAIVFQP